MPPVQSATFDRLCHDLLTAEPFRAFSVELIDGRSLPVTEPDRLAAKLGGGRYRDDDGRAAIFSCESVVTITTGYVPPPTHEELLDRLRTRPDAEA